MIKVIGGTTFGDRHLCLECRNCHRNTKGQRCEIFGKLSAKITECNRFRSVYDEGPGRMDQQAWYITQGEDGPVFRSPDEREFGRSPRTVRVRIGRNPRPVKDPEPEPPVPVN